MRSCRACGKEARSNRGLHLVEPFADLQAEHIMHSLENELYFYARIFGIALPEGSVSEPVEIENLE